MKKIVALARLYKGILIFEVTGGFVIFNAVGQRVPFATEQEAHDYIDGWSLAETCSAN